jgi:hypothetical protein
VVVGFGVRPFSDVELLFSSSLTQRYADDPRDFDVVPTLSQAFLSGSIPGAYRVTRILYSELALRLIAARPGGVSTGALLEGYAGTAQGVAEPTLFRRVGFQAAAFLPFVRTSTIISPKITVDGLLPDSTNPVPFIEMPGQPTFRGFDNRRDYVSAVASLDYRWYLMRFLGARLFFDVARVAPSIREMTVDNLRWAAGFGFDFHTSTSELRPNRSGGQPRRVSLSTDARCGRLDSATGSTGTDDACTLALWLSCVRLGMFGYRPALRGPSPVAEVHDDAPIPVPRWHAGFRSPLPVRSVPSSLASRHDGSVALL